MKIYSVTYPGLYPCLPDGRGLIKLSETLDLMREQFFTANHALNLFNQAQANLDSRSTPIEERQRKSEMHANRWQSIVKRVEKEFCAAHNLPTNSSPSPDQSSEIYFLAAAEMAREDWAQGIVPEIMVRLEPFMHAKSFVGALDLFQKLLSILDEEKYCPNLSQWIATFALAFPDLREVRNSDQHSEDRVRRIGPRGKPIVIAPIDNGHIKSHGVLVMGRLVGTRYIITKADGALGEVDISAASMDTLQRIFQEVINSFPDWQFDKSIHPSH